MIFRIESTSPKPVYQQIVDQVKYAVATSRLVPGDRLDPIRDVAVATRVNRNTIARAYMELEREGVIRTRVGQGSFVLEDGSAPNKARARKVLAEGFDELLAQAHQFRMTEEEVLAILKERLDKVNLKNE